VDFSRAKLSEAQAWEYFAHAKVELEKARAYNKKMGDASPDAQTKLAKAEQQSADANLKPRQFPAHHHQCPQEGRQEQGLRPDREGGHPGGARRATGDPAHRRCR
jgi:hypothetical protein